jgi:hypothetical protein
MASSSFPTHPYTNQKLATIPRHTEECLPRQYFHISNPEFKVVNDFDNHIIPGKPLIGLCEPGTSETISFRNSRTIPQVDIYKEANNWVYHTEVS